MSDIQIQDFLQSCINHDWLSGVRINEDINGKKKKKGPEKDSHEYS